MPAPGVELGTMRNPLDFLQKRSIKIINMIKIKKKSYINKNTGVIGVFITLQNLGILITPGIPMAFSILHYEMPKLRPQSTSLSKLDIPIHKVSPHLFIIIPRGPHN